MLLSVNPKLFLLTVRPHLLNSSLIIAITDHPVPKFNHICVKYHRIKKKKKIIICTSAAESSELFAKHAKIFHDQHKEALK